MKIEVITLGDLLREHNTKINQERSEIDSIVKEIMCRHSGGTAFFDNLDKEIRKPAIIDQIYSYAYKYIVKSGIYCAGLIVSGKFGRFFNNWYNSTTDLESQPMTVIVVNGGIREGASIDNLNYMKSSIYCGNFIFIDDSFYSGDTRNAIKNEIERLGGNLVKTFVIYDGSLIKDNTVESLYRYHKE